MESKCNRQFFPSRNEATHASEVVVVVVVVVVVAAGSMVRVQHSSELEHGNATIRKHPTSMLTRSRATSVPTTRDKRQSTTEELTEYRYCTLEKNTTLSVL